MSYLPLDPERTDRTLPRPWGRGREGSNISEHTARLRRMLIIGLLVMTADWGTKVVLLQLSPRSTIPHYTHPNPLAFVLVLLVAPLILRVVDSKLMMIALGVMIGGSAGNLFERLIGHSVTDFIPLPRFLVAPNCMAGHGCALMCNVADLALWVSVPLLALAFVWHLADRRAARTAR